MGVAPERGKCMCAVWDSHWSRELVSHWTRALCVASDGGGLVRNSADRYRMIRWYRVLSHTSRSKDIKRLVQGSRLTLVLV